MKRICFAIIPLIFLFQSCGMYVYTRNLDKKMRELELGMDKSDVVALLGVRYKVTSALVLPEGEKEEICQYSGDVLGVYDLVFRNGKLVEWQYILPPVKQETEVTVINKTDKNT